ncbi:MAG: hypothetical protein K2Q18_01550, partial [Bdellovibrionales bacterium]|nr:hypothetical protein [Bdellovibrionales bacterium]
MESGIKAINTSVKNLQWYNWVLIIFQSLILLGLIFGIMGMLLNADDILHARDGIQLVVYTAIFTIVAFYVWKRSAYSMLKSQITMTYNENEILSFQTSTKTFVTPILLSDIKSIVRKSPLCIEIIFNQPMENEDVFS